jgi:hypothetical protein
MSRDNDVDPFAIDEDDDSGEESPEIDVDQLRVFSIDDPEDDLDRETVEANPAKPALADVLDDLDRGERLYADLLAFSDLTTADLDLLGVRWPGVTSELRASVVRETQDIAEEDYRLQLSRFFLFASHDEDDQVRQLAVAALGNELGADTATRLLDVVADDESDDIRAEAARSLGPLAELAASDELPDALTARIEQDLFAVAEHGEESWHVRRRAAESVAAFGPHARVNLLVQQMYDEDELGLRASALYAAGRGGQREWLPVAIEELENEDVEIRFEAVRAVGLFGDVDALPRLSEIAREEEDVDVRQAAIAAIGDIGGHGATRILTRLLDIAPESDHELIADAMVEASFVTDPLSFGVDPDA